MWCVQSKSRFWRDAIKSERSNKARLAHDRLRETGVRSPVGWVWFFFGRVKKKFLGFYDHFYLTPPSFS